MEPSGQFSPPLTETVSRCFPKLVVQERGIIVVEGFSYRGTYHSSCELSSGMRLADSSLFTLGRDGSALRGIAPKYCSAFANTSSASTSPTTAGTALLGAYYFVKGL